MAKIESAFFDLSYLDTLARGSSCLHRLDPRIKVVVCALFVLAVVSFPRYAISSMLPFVLLVVVVAGLGRIPGRFIWTKLLIVAPFAVMVGIFNPLFDQQPLLQLGTITVSGGWLSFASILLRVGLTVSSVLILIGTTGFHNVCMALVSLGMPRIFAVQLLLLYRYIFVLVDEGLRMHQARALRTFGRRGMAMGTFTHLLGQLLLRTLDRAQRVHLAMLCRGFDGTIRMRKVLHIRMVDLLVLAGCAATLFLLRFYDVPLLIGTLFTGYFP